MMMLCWCFGMKPKPNKVEKQKKEKKLKTKSDQTSRRDEPSSSSAEPTRALSVSETVQHPRDRTLNFTYQELATATSNFRDSNLIGQGGFGNVYKGKIGLTGQNVAVKKMDTNGVQGDNEFLVEVLMLSLLRHDNLVNLIGYCAQGNQRLIVYEYMPLGSVEDRIHDHRANQRALDWITRMQIAVGAAKGLEFLHTKAEPPVIYRDLKTANILLDHTYKPKLSDFGLAKFGPTGDNSYVTTRVMGTHGYCAPEYAKTGRLTLKSDIYSLGVVLLELISGRKAIGDPFMGSRRVLTSWARTLFMDNNIRMIVDPNLPIEGRHMESTLRRALEVAFTCVREDAGARPTISEVVISLDYILEKIKSRQKKVSIGRKRGGGGSEKRASTSSRKEKTNDKGDVKEYGSDRDVLVADSKIWAEKKRGKQKVEQ